MLKAVLVDDEPSARKLLRLTLQTTGAVTVVGEAGSVAEAVTVLQNAQPDVVFLDVQLREETGFDLLDQMELKCRVVFVTSHDQYAARAFEVNALDYLIKPPEPARLKQTIQRLHQAQPVGAPRTAEKFAYQDRLFLKINNRSGFLKISTIKCIQAEAYLSRLWTITAANVQTNLSLKDWEELLPERQFLKIHRSTIVNLEFVTEVEDWSNRSYRIHLAGMTEPQVVSRRVATQLRERLRP
ncbi:MAG: LytTR family DNA-binding domain-containing protein [Blastocatellia bacterium]|nr:LytTR family DNA-binding domain-containing protein [Blastocatellia bacterium]